MTEPDPRVDARPRAIFLMGPTASGKTALAIDLAQRFGVALISVDSALVYRGLDVGSAKPDAETLRRVPHRLIDVREPEQSYSAAEFRADALREMAAIADGGGVPLLVGGTGLYFRALERGLSELPQADAALRARLDREREAIGLGALHARLAALDPAAAARIHANDPQRIQRALEVIELSGRPLSEQQGRRGARLAYRVLKLVLAPAERAVLHARIETRFRAMLDAGLLDELRRLRARPQLRADHPSMRAVGYRQAWQHLDGEFDAPTLLARGIHATRQLAKRQLTWLRGEHDAFWLDPTAPNAAARLERLLVGHLARPSACGH